MTFENHRRGLADLHAMSPRTGTLHSGRIDGMCAPGTGNQHPPQVVLVGPGGRSATPRPGRR